MLLLASALLSSSSVFSGFDFWFFFLSLHLKFFSFLWPSPWHLSWFRSSTPYFSAPTHIPVPLPLLLGDTKGRNYKLRLKQFTGSSKVIRKRAVTATMLITAVYKRDGFLQAECSLSWTSKWDLLAWPQTSMTFFFPMTIHAHFLLRSENLSLFPPSHGACGTG